MERLQELISQLKEQYERKEDPSQLLLTTRLLEAELTFMAGQSTVIRGSGSAKIAVMMPSSMKMYAGQHVNSETRTIPDSRTVAVAGNGAAASVNGSAAMVHGTASVNGAAVAGNGAAPAGNGAMVAGNGIAATGNGSGVANGNGVHNGANGANDGGSNISPVDIDMPAFRTIPVVQTSIATDEQPVLAYDPIKDIPTLAHQPGSRELNDVIGNNGSSLNDRLKVDVMELAAALNDTPVRDLKKAIGVNDRYVFISQLFRGDEVMYERSIKTINGFRILPEAEYWMERELKVKLGWDENREATRHFYQLIKRRFS
jgi:hypothetical protein